MTTMLIILLVLAIVAAGLMAVRSVNISRFQRKAAVGMLCIFYDGPDRFHGQIIMAEDDTVVISNAYGTYSRLRAEIYPA